MEGFPDTVWLRTHRSFDSIGPLSKTVEDAAELLSVIAGRDKRGWLIRF